MLTEEQIREASDNELRRVHTLIERCLILHMSRSEAVDTLNQRDSIAPAITETVWQNLERENEDFFKAYYMRLMVKDQITKFNNLLKMQLELMYQTFTRKMAAARWSNGSHVPPLLGDSGSHAPFYHEPIISDDLGNPFFNADVPQSIPLAQNSHVAMIQGMNGLTVVSDVGHAGYNHIPTNMMVETSMPSLQGAEFSSSGQILSDLGLPDLSDLSLSDLGLPDLPEYYGCGNMGNFETMLTHIIYQANLATTENQGSI